MGAGFAAVCPQRGLGLRCEGAAEIRTHQVGALVGGGAVTGARGNTGLSQTGGKRFGVECRIHRIARPRVSQAEVQQRCGCQRSSRSCKADPGGRERSQIDPGICSGCLWWFVVAVHDAAGSKARKWAGRPRGRMRSAPSTRP